MTMTTGLLPAEKVLAAVAYDEARTVMEVADVACGTEAWRYRALVRNRLYELEAQGLVICDDERPMRWLRPMTTTTTRPHGPRWVRPGRRWADGCYGCVGTGYHVGFGMPPGVPCLHHHPDCEPGMCVPGCEHDEDA